MRNKSRYTTIYYIDLQITYPVCYQIIPLYLNFVRKKQLSRVILDISRGYMGKPITPVFRYFPEQNTLLYARSYQVRYFGALKFIGIISFVSYSVLNPN
jgi:hypothetical protein